MNFFTVHWHSTFEMLTFLCSSYGSSRAIRSSNDKLVENEALQQFQLDANRTPMPHSGGQFWTYESLWKVIERVTAQFDDVSRRCWVMACTQALMALPWRNGITIVAQHYGWDVDTIIAVSLNNSKENINGLHIFESEACLFRTHDMLLYSTTTDMLAVHLRISVLMRRNGEAIVTYAAAETTLECPSQCTCTEASSEPSLYPTMKCVSCQSAFQI